MTLLGLLCFALAALDLVASLFGFRLTSVGWSPLLFVILGVMFLVLETPRRDDRLS